MRCSSCWRAVRMPLRVVLLALPVLLAFAATFVLIVVLLGWVPGAADLGLENLSVGVLCALVAWLFLAVFHMKRDSVYLRVGERGTFLERLVRVLEELGYEVTAQGPDQFVSLPSFRSLVMGGRLQVRLEGGTARVTGPRMFVELVRRRMRLVSHTDPAQMNGRDGLGERLLKRVAIHLRVTGDQWRGIYDEMLRALAREGAEVVCDLHILAQSEGGIREQVIDCEILTRLRERHIDAEVHKDHPQWDEPSVVRT